MKKILVLFLHLLLEILAWTSFIWFSWKYIAFLGLVHICMLETCDGCFLSHYQFKDKEKENTAFYEWILSKVGIKKYNRKKLRIFMRYYLPLLFTLMGILFQDILGVIKPIF